jgi:hypothetical protein
MLTTAHQVSYEMGFGGGIYKGYKGSICEDGYSPVSGAELRKM